MDSSHPDWRVMVPHCGFYLHFSDNEWCWASFHVFLSHLYVFLGEVPVQFFGPFFDWLPTLHDLMDHSVPGSSVHGILQAWILEWVAMPSSRESSWLRDWTRVSYVIGDQNWVNLPLSNHPVREGSPQPFWSTRYVDESKNKQTNKKKNTALSNPINLSSPRNSC